MEGYRVAIVDQNRPDPNKERNDPMVPDYWRLGEDVQDAILAAGYQSDSVEGIAVDIHDLLQAADRVREELAPNLQAAVTAENLQALIAELDHIRWHCDAAEAFLRQVPVFEG